MTGSPQILEDFRLPKNGHAIDLMDRCVRVEPKHVLLADKAEVTEDMKQRLAAGEKVIYFANRVSTVLNLYRNALQEYRNEAAVSFSSDDELDKQEKETREILEKRDEIQAYIAENQKLPDDIRLFLTTSKNKEGINIKNADIKTMYIETHSQIDAIQMAGRVRAGLDQLYIVTDAVQNSAPESPFEYELSGRADLKASLNALLAQKKEDAGIAEGLRGLYRSTKKSGAISRTSKRNSHISATTILPIRFASIRTGTAAGDTMLSKTRRLCAQKKKAACCPSLESGSLKRILPLPTRSSKESTRISMRRTF